MTTSGTVGQTVITTQSLIDHGARRSGKFAESLTVEQVNASRQNLYYLLSNLANRGIQFWCVEQTIIGMKALQYIYDLPVGTVDVRNVLYRKTMRPTGSYTSSAGGTVSNAFDEDTETICTQTSAGGNIAVQYTVDTYVTMVGLLPGTSSTVNLIIEYSTDGSTWSTLKNPGSTVLVNNEWTWFTIEPGVSVEYYRVRAVSGTLVMREVYFGTTVTDIPMARLNQDDYTNLPNRNFPSNQPLQFWFDRKLDPQVYLWPVPNNSFVQMVCWRQRQIQDVGSLKDSIEVPQRWYPAIQAMLAHAMSLELPDVQENRILLLEKYAEKALYDVEQEERDRSPIYFAPNISYYSR